MGRMAASGETRLQDNCNCKTTATARQLQLQDNCNCKTGWEDWRDGEDEKLVVKAFAAGIERLGRKQFKSCCFYPADPANPPILSCS
jgi:hypothetical protein